MRAGRLRQAAPSTAALPFRPQPPLWAAFETSQVGAAGPPRPHPDHPHSQTQPSAASRPRPTNFPPFCPPLFPTCHGPAACPFHRSHCQPNCLPFLPLEPHGRKKCHMFTD